MGMRQLPQGRNLSLDFFLIRKTWCLANLHPDSKVLLTHRPGKDDLVYVISVRQATGSLGDQFDRDTLILPISDVLPFFDTSDQEAPLGFEKLHRRSSRVGLDLCVREGCQRGPSRLQELQPSAEGTFAWDCA